MGEASGFVMGYGDNLMATGMAKGAKALGFRVAFGDGKKILWDHLSEPVFRGNPNVAVPGEESAKDIHWTPFYRGNRLYNKEGAGRWIWNYEFRAQPGEMFLSAFEKKAALHAGTGHIVIEPNVPTWKHGGQNKVWPVNRYVALAAKLQREGHRVIQFVRKNAPPVRPLESVHMTSFRDACAALANAQLYIGLEGGMHHAAAALGIPAVVLFGGWIPPEVTGYRTHTNMTGSANACGSWTKCEHCQDAMDRISVDEVYSAARKYLG